MLNKWTAEIERGRRDADAIVGRMRLVVWRMVEVAFMLGLLVGAALGAGLVLLWT